MSQFLSQNLTQQMRLEQRLTPQLIQSMTILQKPVTELEAFINDALERNAALEIAEPEASEEAPPENGRHRQGTDDLGFARLARYSADHDLEAGERPPYVARRAMEERDAKMGALANTAGREISLQEFLLEQWSLLDLAADVRRAGEVVIDNIEPDGYLRQPLEKLVNRAKPPVSIGSLEKALDEVQHKLDPVGVGARDVIECLLLQLDALPGNNDIEKTLVERHLDDLVRNRLPAVAKATGYSLGEIKEALQAMRRTLHLHPGYLVGDRQVPPIRPDVIVEYAGTGGGLTVRLARGNLPELRISTEVQELARTKRNGKETRDFARQQVELASAIIDAVNFRKSRLLEVSRAIVEKQHEFFDVGPAGLKIFRMSDLATELGCDPSTISRTVADKYMQTPRGIFPLRYFFTGGTETDTGESMGWDRVKTRVSEMIEAEDRNNPFSDDQIAALLKKEGIEISRRTVAKYRQQLNIPAARQRREY